VSGAGLGAKSRKVAKASQVTIRVKLTKAALSSLHRARGHHKKVTSTALLEETGGGQLKARTTSRSERCCDGAVCTDGPPQRVRLASGGGGSA
jgi:hypothetical protein